MFVLDDYNCKKYSVIENHFITEQNIESVELLHEKTGAKIILFICDDENRVFNIAFKTPVSNSKGTPHILEHSVLCGSRKYNVKDPFIELAKGSLNTFLNAMTFPDKTCYPVASANLKDFHNLVDVYLDAVFYPNVIKNEKIFRQEGWHYEITDLKDNLKVNGVVYNEMKGVYSDPDSVLESGILSNMYEGTNYSHDYGGNPKDIIDLDFNEFVEFHHRYYSPSNAVVYFYGKLDYNAELKYISDEYFDNFSEIKVDAKFLDVKNAVKNKERIDYYNVDTSDVKDKAYLAYSFSMDDEKTSLEHIVMQIIDYVLFKSESAILKEKLMNEGLGESVFSHYEVEIKNALYSVVLQNVDEGKKDQFIKLFNDSINSIINNGLDVDKFKAGINSLYFTYAEGEFGRVPKGLFYSLVSLDTYMYGGKPYIHLEYKKEFDYINKVDLHDKDNMFIKTLKKVFIDNNHTGINVLRPKYGYSEEKDRQLSELLDERKSKFNDSELKELIDDVKELKVYQLQKDSIEDLKCIPMLKLSDIEKSKKLIDYQLQENDGIDTIVTYDNDKDIIYLGVSFDITDFTKEEFYLLSAMNVLWAKTDLKSMSYHGFNNYIDMNTGGLDPKIDIYENKALMTFGIKVVENKIEYAYDVLYKLFSDTIFNDIKRIKILLNECKSNSLLSVLSAGHIATSNRAKSSIDFASSIADKVSPSGIGFYKFLNSVCKVYEDKSDTINDTLDLLLKKIISQKMYINICANKKYYGKAVDEFKKFNIKIAELKSSYKMGLAEKLRDNILIISSFIPFDDFDKKVKTEAIITPNDVNFCAMAGKFNKEEYSGRLIVLKTLFNYEYLWTNIRVLGGAYGCMSMFNKNGNYVLVSYRDPNVSNTNKVFYGVREFLDNVSVSDEEVTKYIIGSIGVFDNPLSIVNKHKENVAAYFNSDDDMSYNKKRSEVLNMKAKDFNDLSKVFYDIDNCEKCALICANKVEEAKKEYESIWQLIS